MYILWRNHSDHYSVESVPAQYLLSVFGQSNKYKRATFVAFPYPFSLAIVRPMRLKYQLFS